jgi:hypothetical protein
MAFLAGAFVGVGEGAASGDADINDYPEAVALLMESFAEEL